MYSVIRMAYLLEGLLPPGDTAKLQICMTMVRLQKLWLRGALWFLSHSKHENIFYVMLNLFIYYTCQSLLVFFHRNKLLLWVFGHWIAVWSERKLHLNKYNATFSNVSAAWQKSRLAHVTVQSRRSWRTPTDMNSYARPCVCETNKQQGCSFHRVAH